MCWSFGASAILAIIGLAVSLYLAFKKRSPWLWIPIVYFALMEVIQAATYLFLNNCNSPANQLLTFLGYIHIVFQPFFINMFTMYFIPKKVRDKICGYVYAVCFICAVLMLIRLYPFDWAGTCIEGVAVMCGTPICAVAGNWHLAWNIPFNGLSFGSPYILAVFILPLIYGAWRVALYGGVFGLIPAYFLTSNINERPAVWCLLSIALMLAVFIKPVMKWLRAKKWYFGHYPWVKIAA
jgi:hypothetical protein